VLALDASDVVTTTEVPYQEPKALPTVATLSVNENTSATNATIYVGDTANSNISITTGSITIYYDYFNFATGT
jgi:glycine betaine/choline ABC-type transport system substrate-binding protein